MCVWFQFDIVFCLTWKKKRSYKNTCVNTCVSQFEITVHIKVVSCLSVDKSRLQLRRQGGRDAFTLVL